MTNLVMKLVMFSIMINLSVGIMSLAVPGFSLDTHPELSHNLFYNGNLTNNSARDLGGVINLGGDVKSSSNNQQGWLFDIINLGLFFTNITKFLNTYMFGLSTLLESIVGGALGPELSLSIFGSFKSLITLLYTLFLIQLITGKKIVGEMN